MEYIKKINVPMALLCVLAARLLFTDSAFAMSILGLGVIALYGYNQYLESKKEIPVNDEVKREIESIKNQISNISVKTNVKPIPTQKFF